MFSIRDAIPTTKCLDWGFNTYFGRLSVFSIDCLTGVNLGDLGALVGTSVLSEDRCVLASAFLYFTLKISAYVRHLFYLCVRFELVDVAGVVVFGTDCLTLVYACVVVVFLSFHLLCGCSVLLFSFAVGPLSFFGVRFSVVVLGGNIPFQFS